MMTSNSGDCEWQKLPWAEKVHICQRGIAHEDTLLITYVVIFIALEAMFFAVFGVPASYIKITSSILGILVAIRFVCIFKKAGDAVDRWGTILHDLWEELNEQELCKSGVKTSEFVKAHQPSVEKWNRRKRIKGWLEIIFFWWDNKCPDAKSNCLMIRWLKIGWCNISAIVGSRRRMMTTCTPLLVIAAWAFVICQMFDP